MLYLVSVYIFISVVRFLSIFVYVCTWVLCVCLYICMPVVGFFDYMFWGCVCV